MTSVIKNSTRILVAVTFLLMFLIQALPEMLINDCSEVNQIRLCVDGGQADAINGEIEDALILLSENFLFDASKQYAVFVINNDLIYTVLTADFFGGSFARTNAFNNVIVRRCDTNGKVCYSNSKEHNQRTLSALIAHEITHVNIRNAIGYINELWLPAWKKEGVADYIAQSSSYSSDSAMDSYIQKRKIDSKSFNYFIYRMIARYALEDKGLSIRNYLANTYDMDMLWSEDINH